MAHGSILSLVHRTLINDRNILHRDMSGNNILVQPTHNKRTEDEDFKLASDAPRFIAEVLEGKAGPRECVQPISLFYLTSDSLCRLSPSSTRDRAACLLIDLDNGADMDIIEKDEAIDALTKRTVRVHNRRPH